MEQLRFSFPEILSLFGVFQCVYILVYVSFRTIKLSHVILPLLYFFVLGCAFFLDFAREYVSDLIPYFEYWSWAAWAYIVPFGVLLIFQMAKISKLPRWPVWSVLLLIPLAFMFSVLVTKKTPECADLRVLCTSLDEWLSLSALIAGALSLLMIWAERNIFADIRSQSAGRERYWLILSLIILNIFYLGCFALALGVVANNSQAELLRTVLGLTFCYLVSTSLFRIYPSALILAPDRKKVEITELIPAEHELVKKINDLLNLQKVYHEPTYTRSDMARELGVSEATLSKVINIQYQKSFPQILNEKRVQDAKRLLLETHENIKVIAQEVGFNSLPSFNRAFKEYEGRNPSDYRKYMIK